MSQNLNVNHLMRCTNMQGEALQNSTLESAFQTCLNPLQLRNIVFLIIALN